MTTEKFLKDGCMGCLLVIGGIFVLVIILTFYFAINPRKPLDFSTLNDERQQNFEVLTKKGTVTLHLGMPKDSVIMIVGEPDNIRSHSEYDNDIIEVLEYSIKDRFNDLSFTFENGKLKEFNQN